MKLKALLLALFVAGLTASLALADGPPGKDHHKGKNASTLSTSSTTTTTSKESEHGKGFKPCRPSIELEFAGTVAAAPTSAGLLAVDVTKGRAGGQSLAGKQLTVDVSQARVRGTLAASAPVRMHVRACVDVVALTVNLVAVQVNVGGSSSSGGEDGGSTSTTTTGSTSTTGSTTSSTGSTTTTG